MDFGVQVRNYLQFGQLCIPGRDSVTVGNSVRRTSGNEER